MERIDKVISSQTEYSRKEIKELIRKKRIKINEKIVSKADEKVNSEVDIILIDDKKIEIKKFVYLILNKPKGYISATEDKEQKTVLDLISTKYLYRKLFPAGRLDKDTTGLMLITDDGAFTHEILSPKKHVKKVYNVKLDIPVTEEMKNGFKNGIKLNDGKCKIADLKILNVYECVVTLTEGRYHQIKRMFGCYGAKVVELKRIQMGELQLPKDLLEGESRELTKEELKKIK